MIRSLFAIALLALVGSACAQTERPPVAVDAPQHRVRFTEEVEPILEARCVTCHSCYNAGCQLKLSSWEGLARGGSKEPVYSASRLVHATPTRLFMDASSTAEWRTLGFHSVTESPTTGRLNDSVMLHLLDAKRRSPISEGDYWAEAEDLACPANAKEVGSFLADFPGRGMPFGLPALEEAEYQVLAGWLAQGAPGPGEAELLARRTPAAANRPHVERWERFLNQSDPKHAVTARYLYEHFFLAHLVFTDGDASEFYELVRSTTPPGLPIDVIATVRPYDDPGVDPFFYRLRKIHSTIVHKTHMVVPWTDETLARYRELFIQTEWLEPPHPVLWDTELGANPFRIFAQIPPEVRYRFLLDHSEYFVRTFIRGPVCKGQVALNVIHDHFWIAFLEPDADATVHDPAFLLTQSDNLRLPTEEGSDEALLETFGNAYRKRYAAFYRAKLDLYERVDPDGFTLDDIWRGRRAEDSPLLTVYRHFDSASVHKGVLGGMPRTLWVIDYSHLERIYYALVAGFDVYGNVSHQVNVRRYMDYLRMEGELNYLQFMPQAARAPILQSWYLGDGAFDDVGHGGLLTVRPSRVAYTTDDPRRELIEQVVRSHIRKDVGITFDPINYHGDRPAIPMPQHFETREDLLDGFRALTAPGTGFIAHYNQFGVNVLYMRVRDYQGSDHFFSIVINRWHDNVNSMFGEKDFLDPSRDTMDFLPGQISSYPNYFFDVAGEDVSDFFDMLENFDGSDTYVQKLYRYGVNRAEPDFWEAFDWFQARVDQADPLQAGLLDLNRYYHAARPGS